MNSGLSELKQAQPDLLLDLHLHTHVAALYDRIRKKALVQYFTPYLTVDLGTMAAAFNATPAALEEELIALITSGQIAARIDAYNGVLVADKKDTLQATIEMSVEFGEAQQRLVQHAILRMNMKRQGLVLKDEEESARVQ